MPQHRWQKGAPSANPKGRPRTGLALAEIIRAQLEGPGVMAELTQRMIDIALGRAVCIDSDWLRACAEARREGKPMPPPPDKGDTVQPSLADSLRAWDMLCKQGGVPQQVAVSTSSDGEVLPGTFDHTKLSPAEAGAFEAILRKAAGLDPLPDGEPIDAESVEVLPALPAPR